MNFPHAPTPGMAIYQCARHWIIAPSKTRKCPICKSNLTRGRWDAVLVGHVPPGYLRDLAGRMQNERHLALDTARKKRARIGGLQD